MLPKTLWCSNSEVRKRNIADKTLLLTIKSNRLLVLSEHAQAIWDQLDCLKACRESDIAEALQREYSGVTVEQIRLDVHRFLSGLQEKGFARQEDKVTSRPNFNTNTDGQGSVSGHFSFSEKLHQLATQKNIPISAGLEITQRCHLRCMHCYIDDQPINYSNELSTKELLALLDQIVSNGCLWLLITGGEPLLRKDFLDVYYHAKELGMIVTVFTSATTLNERIANAFVEYPPFLVESTLHGAKKKTFDAISGISGSFKDFQRGIHLLQERSIPFHLKMIVMKQNVDEVEDARQLALKMGARDFRFDPMVNADFLHSRKAVDLRISVAKALQLDLLGPYKSRWNKIFRTAIVKRATHQVSDKLLFPCRAGKCSFTISADGKLLPCILMRVPEYDLRKLSFTDAWKELNRYTTNALMQEDNPCLTYLVQTCSKCPAWGYLEQGDPNTKSRFACTLQQEREKIFLPEG